MTIQIQHGNSPKAWQAWNEGLGVCQWKEGKEAILSFSMSVEGVFTDPFSGIQ